MSNRPDVPEETHPVECNKLLLLTPAINGLIKELKRWLRGRLPGGMVYGVPRVGKTWAIKYIKKLAMGYTCLSVTMRDLNSNTPKAFCQHFLKQLNMSVDPRDTTEALWTQLTTHLASEALHADKKGVLLLINDAQKMSDEKFRWLHDLHNALDDQNLYACFVLVGQEAQLVEWCNSFVASGMAEIVGRFMSMRFKMHGIRSQEELAFVMEGYDDKSEYPKGSGCPYARYYFPQKYDDGWRLQHEAPLLWQAFELVRQEERVAQKLEIPLHYIVHSINNGLIDHSRPDGSHFEFNLAIWKNAVKNSGYAGVNTYIKTAGPTDTDES